MPKEIVPKIEPGITLKGRLIKVGKGALIAMAGALLTYLATTIPNVDFGVYTPFVAGIVAILINFARQVLAEYMK